LNGTIAGGLDGNGTRANAITFTAGSNTLTLNSGAVLTGNIEISGSLTFDQPGAFTLSNVITGSGSVTKTGAGTLTLTANNTYFSGTTISGGLINFSSALNFGPNTVTLNGGGLQWATGTTTDISGKLSVIGANGAVFDTNGNNVTFATALSGAGGIAKAGAGTLKLNSASSYTGNTTVEAGTLQQGVAGAFVNNTAYTVNGGWLDLNSIDLTASSLSGAGGRVLLYAGTLTVDQSSNTEYAGIISGTGGLIKNGTGSLTLGGDNVHFGATTVNGGRLAMNGYSPMSAVTVNAGGELGGTGTVGATTINGGTLAPGNSIGTLTVSGNLSFTSSSTFAVEVSPSAADRVNVNGTATLGGARVAASFAPGAYVSKQYTILNAYSRSGTFGSKVDTNLPTGFSSSLSYDAQNAYLDLTLDYTPPTPGGSGSPAASPIPNSGLNLNQGSVANALTNSFNSKGGIPAQFGALTPAGLSQASGEPATGAQTASNDAMTQFMGTLVDPSPEGRGVSIAPAPGSFASYAAYGSGKSAASKGSDLPTRTAVLTADPDAWRWSVWGSGFGGAQFTGANASAGTAANTNRVYGAAAGADYRLTPSTIAGFALAGGATSFNTYGLGSGKSDLFQAGLFLRQHFGQSYLSAGLAYGWQDVTTDRSVAGERLEAQFNVNSWSGRLEAGHRFALGPAALTPYAAAQFTAIALPDYAERALAGTSLFALSYASRDVNTTRSELGLRADASFNLAGLPLSLRGAVAWVHNFETATSALASFQSLPGATFLVSGAALDRNALRTTATAELDLKNGLSIAATFDGEFGENSRSLGGKGAIRYRW